MSDLLVSKCITPDGTVLQSRHVHDYVTHLDANGEEYMLDGGIDYIRCSVNKDPASDCSCYTSDSIEKIREHFSWGSYGVDGDEPLHYILLKDMDSKHIEAILAQYESAMVYRVVYMFYDELDYRRNNEC